MGGGEWDGGCGGEGEEEEETKEGKEQVSVVTGNFNMKSYRIVKPISLEVKYMKPLAERLHSEWL